MLQTMMTLMILSRFRFWLTVHWLAFHDNNTQSATCIWPSLSSNSHSQLRLVSSRKLSRTSSWRRSGMRRCGLNVRVQSDWWAARKSSKVKKINLNVVFSVQTWPTSSASSSASSSVPRIVWLHQPSRSWRNLPPRTEHSTASRLRVRSRCQQRNRRQLAPRRRRLSRRSQPQSQQRSKQ